MKLNQNQSNENRVEKLVELDDKQLQLTPSTLEVLDMEQLEGIAGGPLVPPTEHNAIALSLNFGILRQRAHNLSEGQI